MSSLEIHNLTFQYPTGNSPALKDVSLCLSEGEFGVLFGPSGCGKSTLLKQMLRHEVSGRLGYVGQNPEDGIVTDKVWHELSFGLENQGCDTETIRKRVAEISQFFGIQTWFHQDTYALSGGQKQLLNLASAMTMHPEVLLLDEPTSQLDPIAAVDFLAMVNRIHKELGTTILIVEHRLEELLGYCNRIYYMQVGQIVKAGTPMEIIQYCMSHDKDALLGMPAAVRIIAGLMQNSEASMSELMQDKIPLDVGEGRWWLGNYIQSKQIVIDWVPEEISASKEKREGIIKDPLISVKDIHFRYDKKGNDILKGLSFDIRRGEVLAMLGGNGSGKTTALSILTGALKAYSGKILKSDKKHRIAYVPQDPQTLFICDIVEEELTSVFDASLLHLSKSAISKENQEILNRVIVLCDLRDCMTRHPYDLSGGEQQKLALAKILLSSPEVLLLDEPTKGLDASYKMRFAEILAELKAQGMGILMVSHDIEFCAENTDYCMLLFDGQCATVSKPREFFEENYFYTTAATRIAKDYIPHAITVNDVVEALQMKVNVNRINESIQNSNSKRDNPKDGSSKINRIEKAEEEKDRIEKDRIEKDVSKIVRNLVMIITVLGLIPFTIFAGIHFFNDERFLFISLVLVLECMIPFFLRYENRKPTTQDSVLLAVLCAIAVIGRVIFAPFPQFKPVTAITIIAGAVFGPEAGFLLGASAMLISNIVFGQGPWTPWQMFAMGCMGLVAGLIFHHFVERMHKTEMDGEESVDFHIQNRKRTYRTYALTGFLCIYGMLAPIIIYGGIIDPSTAILARMDLNVVTVITMLVSGFLFNVVHGASTMIFLAVLSTPMIRKLHRVKLKYKE